MKFDELGEKMRVYETALDHCVLPETFRVARVDGRGFTRLTREVHQFKAPFDERFRDMMVSTDRTPDELRVPGRLRLHAER
jgi:tRNA(His) 5'-end guanylyltransferase